MKQYVLDEPTTAAPPPPREGQALSLTRPGWGRWLVLAVLLEAIALAALYVALNGVSGASRAEASPGVAYVASFSFPREAQAAQAPTDAPPGVPAVSRIRQERGRYLVDLRDETPAAAVEKLAQATRARVAGSNVFADSALRLTRSVVATTPREAWQAVFGDVANFVITCAGSVCDIRFVSLAKPGAPLPGPASRQGEFSRTEPTIAPAFAPAARAAVDPAAAGATTIVNSDGTVVDN